MLDLVDGPQIAAQAKMIRAKFAGTILVVEGPTDKRLLERFVDEAECVVVCAYGKQNALGAVERLDDEAFAGALGFVDSDFDRVDGRDLSGDNIVVCDCADSEMMLLASPALEKTLAEYGSKSKLESFIKQSAAGDVRKHLFEEGAKLAMLRHASHQYGWSLCFKGANFKKFVDSPSLTLDLQKAATHIVANSKQAGLAPDDVLTALPPTVPVHPRHEYCSGHDCTELLALGFRKALATHPQAVASKENVERLLRLAYELDHFVRTAAFAAIQAWERANPPFRVLVAE